jgi:hypothetical protein
MTLNHGLRNVKVYFNCNGLSPYLPSDLDKNNPDSEINLDCGYTSAKLAL